MRIARLKQWWNSGVHRVRDEVDEVQDELEHTGLRWRLVWLVIATYLVVVLVTGFYWSFRPPLVSLPQVQADVLRQSEIVSPPLDITPLGAATTASLIYIAQSLWKKPGGYLYNDLTPPGIWLDDMPNWEYGVVVQVRDTCRVMREHLALRPSGSEDPDLQKAESRFQFSHDSWLIPSTESQYREGVGYLRAYLHRLYDASANQVAFKTDAASLDVWLARLETRLGRLSQRLSASVAGEGIDEKGMALRTPWLKIDNVFYEARGSAWAMVYLLRAIEVDFAAVLTDTKAGSALDDAIHELEASQAPLYSPVVLNGSGFGLVANHSLVMAAHLSRASNALVTLRRQLEQMQKAAGE